ncbi:MAG: QueT transporter family protein, partial [Ruthenibacterium lactatiformans]
MKKTKTRTIVRCALIASLYTAVSLVLAPIAFGAVQARVSEAFTLLPVLVPDAVVGVTLGCFLTNLVGVFTGANVLGALDIVFGTAATLTAALCTRRLARVRLRGLPVAAAVPPVLINAVVVGAELAWAFGPRTFAGFCFRPAVLRWGSSSPASRWACRWCASLKKRPRCGRGSGIERFFRLFRDKSLSCRPVWPNRRPAAVSHFYRPRSETMPVFDTVLWDWNGTLLDDAALCCELLNTMLARHGYAPVGSMEAYRQVFCFPIETYYRRAGFDFSRHPFAALADEYMRLYTPRSLGCPLQPDACAVLDALRAQGMRQVMLSASKRENLQQQVEHFGLRSRFDTLLGLSDIYAKSKTEVGLRWLRESGADPARIMMVGDSEHDFEVARALGVRCVLFSGGHQPREVLAATGAPVIDALAQL